MSSKDQTTPAERYRSPATLPTAHEREIATILIEECAELTKALTKLLRFGAEDGYPGSPVTNRSDASNEAGDVIEMIDRAIKIGLLDKQQIEVGRLVKREKLTRYMQTDAADGETAPRERALRQALMWCVVNDGETLADHPKILHRFREMLGVKDHA
jgi:hypothetical protein